MLINSFKRNYISQYVIIFIISILLWLGAFINPVSRIENLTSDGILYHFFQTLFTPLPFLSVIISLLIIIIEGFYINYILYQHKLIAQNTLLPMLLYIIVMSIGSVQTLSPIIFSNFFIIIALSNLLKCSNIDVALDKIFTASAMVSIASLFYFPAIYFMIFIIIVLIIFEIYYWREWIVMIFGGLFPLIFITMYCFFTDSLKSAFDQISTNFIPANIQFNTSNTWMLCIEFFFVILLIITLIKLLIHTSENVVIYRKKAIIISWMVLIGVIMSFYGKLVPISMQLFAIPFSFLLSSFFTVQKHHLWIYDSLLILIVLTTFLSIYIF